MQVKKSTKKTAKKNAAKRTKPTKKTAVKSKIKTKPRTKPKAKTQKAKARLVKVKKAKPVAVKTPKAKAPKITAGRPIELKHGLGELAQAVGSVGLLSKKLDVDPCTVQRWSRLGRAPKIARVILASIAHQYGVNPPFQAKNKATKKV